MDSGKGIANPFAKKVDCGKTDFEKHIPVDSFDHMAGILAGNKGFVDWVVGTLANHNFVVELDIGMVDY
jgi:hypothetical protein